MTIVPPGWRTVTPRIVAPGARALVEFLRRVFDATGDYRDGQPSEIWIGDSVLMISDAGVRPPMTAYLYVYVADVDATCRRALEAGARVLEPRRRCRTATAAAWSRTGGATRGRSRRASAAERQSVAQCTSCQIISRNRNTCTVKRLPRTHTSQ